MLDGYRTWLEAELQTLGRQTQDAYVLGQLEMVNRAIARLDSERGAQLPLTIRRPEAISILTALEMLGPTANEP